MKIAYCSDLHLDIGQSSHMNFNLPDADVMILAGDISEVWYLVSESGAWRRANLIEFLRAVSAKYKHVLWIPGNHEYYQSSIHQAELIVKVWLKNENIENINFTSCSSVKIDDVNFILATLWTDFKKEDPIVMLDALAMNDYNFILISDMGIGRNLRPKDVYNIHRQHRSFLIQELYGIGDNSRTVVVTHHAPNMKSEERITSMSWAYCCSDMDQIIMDYQPKYWIHGHTHHKIKYNIGETEVISNPRGYAGYEQMANNFSVEVIEI